MVEQDFSYLLSMMNAFKNDDFKTAGEYCGKLMSTVPSVKGNNVSTNRGLVQRSETNAEKAFFDRFDLELYAEKLGCSKVAFLNPNRGSIKRYAESVAQSGYFKRPLDVYVTSTVDREYYDGLATRCAEYGWDKPRIKKVQEMDKDILYYLSFGAGKSFVKHLRHYIGFRPNMVAMKLAGVQITSSDMTATTFSYKRGRQIERVAVHNAGAVYKVDVVQTYLDVSKKYVPAQGVFHDLVSSSLVTGIDTKIIPATPYPLQLEYNESSRRYKKVHQIPGKWQLVEPYKPVPGRYVRSRWYGHVYDLGQFMCAEEAPLGNCDFQYKKVGYIVSKGGKHIFRRHRNGELVYRGYNYKYDAGWPVVENLSEFLYYNLSAMTIFRYEEVDILGNVPLPLTDIGKVIGMTSEEMEQLIEGFNSADKEETA